MKYIQVAVDVPRLSGLFDYHLPPDLEDQDITGCLVEVPFGRRQVQGIALGEVTIPQVLETRPISAVLDPIPVVTGQQIKLSEWMSRKYLTSQAACLSAMVPPGLSQRSDDHYELLTDTPPAERPFSPQQQRIVDLLSKRGPLRGRQLEAAMSHKNWRRTAKTLEERSVLSSKPILLPPTVNPKVVKTVQLACSPEEAYAQMDQLGRAGAGQRRADMLTYILNQSLPVAVGELYAAAGGSMADLKVLADRHLVAFGETEIWRDPLDKIDWVPAHPPVLTEEQRGVWQQVRTQLNAVAEGKAVKPVLLHGVTGSGKTEIYMRAAAEMIAAGRQVIILVPEISLTPQTVRRFMSRFPGQVGVLHSRLSPGERYDTWRRVRAGKLPIVVGPRSALFAPLSNIGLIIVDECHDDSYYQSDHQPIFNATWSAVAYANQTRSLIILGSATPDIGMTYYARRQRWTTLTMPFRVLAHREVVLRQMAEIGQAADHFASNGEAAHLPMPPVSVVDMRQELMAGNRSILSRSLQTALKEVLDAGQQAILFLNRRGTSTYVFCRACGYSLRCPRCDLPLTLHQRQGALTCHVCGYKRKMPETCPECGSKHIRHYGTGTEKVQEVVQTMFPDANVLRWDTETARQKGAHEVIMSHFVNHRADILVGTQMLAKGLDLPLVTLVGVILADVGLNFPDYRAAERSFQLLTQVAGRAGRSPLGGKVVFQTFQPDNYVIQAAAKHDFQGFYDQEILNRQTLHYPPFTRLIRLEFRDLKLDKVERNAKQMSNQIQNWIHSGRYPNTEMVGPVPCFFSRLNGYYRWQILIKGPNPERVLAGKDLSDCRVSVNPPSLL